tara:strand:- start:697 stop:888 length:192 start_codon:yes stop_codon:yes gene_type:complete
MSHTITDPAKLTTVTVSGTQSTIHTIIQTALRGLAAGDKIVDISIIRKSVGNNFIAIITFEDQ